MRIRQTNVNLVYQKVTDWRKKFVTAEDILSEHFMPAAILPIPDEVQEQVPRAIIQSKHGHSVLNVALTVSSFTTTYSHDYIDSWTLCEEYLKDRCDSVYNLVDNLSGTNYEYVGLITNIEYDDIDQSSLEIIKNSIFKNCGKELGNIFDISCKFTYVYKNTYYINITLENTRKLFAQENKSGIRIKAGNSEKSIAVTIDINDRYAANQDNGYKSEKSAFDEILRITADIINNELGKMIREGRFDYVGE